MLNERQTTILNYIAEHGEAKNAELLSLIGDYSMMTLWRDLAKLEQDGQVIRIRGGAMSAQANVPGQEVNFTYRVKQNISAKEEIARITVDLIHTNHAYYLDAGSTIFTLAHQLHEGNYTIVTSAANTAAEMIRRNNHNITLLGGQINASTFSCSGPQAEHMLSEMNIDIAVMATSGYSANGGFSVGCLPEAQLKRQVLKKAAFTILLMDNAKIARNHPFTFASMDDIDVLIGDSQMPAEFIQIAQTHNVQVFTPNDGMTPEERDALVQELFDKKYQ